jgi:hypothetical protein
VNKKHLQNTQDFFLVYLELLFRSAKSCAGNLENETPLDMGILCFKMYFVVLFSHDTQMVLTGYPSSIMGILFFKTLLIFKLSNALKEQEFQK